MFWITFVVSGLTVASIPWIAKHFSNEVAGLILLLPRNVHIQHNCSVFSQRRESYYPDDESQSNRLSHNISVFGSGNIVIS